MSEIGKGSYLEQGEGGARRMKSSGSHLDQGEGGARRGKSISQRGGEIPAVVPKGSSRSGDHLNPPGPWVRADRTADRQGGTVRGHDRTSPSAGKSKSGSKFAQHPNNKRK